MNQNCTYLGYEFACLPKWLPSFIPQQILPQNNTRLFYAPDFTTTNINNFVHSTFLRYQSFSLERSHRFSHRIALKSLDEFKNGNFLLAYRLCTQWLAEEGENAECYCLLGALSLRLKRLEEASRFSDRAIALNVSLPEPYVFKGMIAQTGGNLNDAIYYYHIALKIQADNIEALVGLSKCHFLLNSLDEALRFCESALQRCPESLSCWLELGNILKGLGRVYEAERCYDLILSRKIDYGPAWLNLGYIYSAYGSSWLALHAFERAITFEPNILDCYMAYGNLLKDVRLFERAIYVYLKGLALFPSNPTLYGYIGGCYHELGLLDLAIDNLKHAITILPTHSDALCNLANVYKEKGLISDAEHYYNAALQACPTHADSYNNLANIYREQGKLHESLQLYNKALEISPYFSAAHINLSTIHQLLGNYAQSVYHLQRSISVYPSNADTHVYLGNVYREIGNYKSSLECYLRALEINPINPDIYSCIGILYKDMSNINESIHYFSLSLNYRPNHSEVLCHLIHCYQLVCDWKDYTERMKRVVCIINEQQESNRTPTVHPHHTMLYPLTGEQRKWIAYKNSTICVDKNSFLGFKKPFEHIRPSTIPNKIKIGYVSSDFCNHPTSHLMQSIPGLHDKSRFEVYCYSLIPDDCSSFSRKLRREVSNFYDISNILDNAVVANMIREHGIHILMNLNGYTKGARNEIFALKPAPIQIMYLGYPSTSGATYMDYIITDQYTSPIEYANDYSEKFAYMPNSFFIGDHANMFPHVLKDVRSSTSIHKISVDITQRRREKHLNSSELKYIYDEKSLDEYINFHIQKRRQECDGCKNWGELIPEQKLWYIDRNYLKISNQKFVFCNFNQLYKLDPNTFSCWCRILQRVPHGVLWLLRFPKQGEDNIREYACKVGLAQERIIFSEVAGKEEHVRRGQLADLCLDTPLCNGHTTGMDVLWCGCPIITMPMQSFASRVGSSLLNTIGCSELIVKNYQEYEDLAVRLATDHEYFKVIKAKIWNNRVTSPLFDIRQYTRDFDQLLTKIVDRYVQNGSNEHITL